MHLPLVTTLASSAHNVWSGSISRFSKASNPFSALFSQGLNSPPAPCPLESQRASKSISKPFQIIAALKVFLIGTCSLIKTALQETKDSFFRLLAHIRHLINQRYPTPPILPLDLETEAFNANSSSLDKVSQNYKLIRETAYQVGKAFVKMGKGPNANSFGLQTSYAPEKEKHVITYKDTILPYLVDKLLGFFVPNDIEALTNNMGNTVPQILIKEIYKGSPAEKAGLKENDIITHVDGEIVTDKNKSSLAKKLESPRLNVSVKIQRQEDPITLEIEKIYKQSIVLEHSTNRRITYLSHPILFWQQHLIISTALLDFLKTSFSSASSISSPLGLVDAQDQLAFLIAREYARSYHIYLNNSSYLRSVGKVVDFAFRQFPLLNFISLESLLSSLFIFRNREHDFDHEAVYTAANAGYKAMGGSSFYYHWKIYNPTDRIGRFLSRIGLTPEPDPIRRKINCERIALKVQDKDPAEILYPEQITGLYIERQYRKIARSALEKLPVIGALFKKRAPLLPA